MQCLNTSNKQVKAELEELTQALGSYDAAYYVMSENNGYSLDKAPNGAESKLFKDLLDNFNGNRVEAIKAKAKIYSDSFKNWFGDWLSDDKEGISKVVDENGEPLLTDLTTFDNKPDNIYDSELENEININENAYDSFNRTGENYQNTFMGDNTVFAYAKNAFDRLIKDGRFFVTPFHKEIAEFFTDNIGEVEIEAYTEKTFKDSMEFAMTYIPGIKGKIILNKDIFDLYSPQQIGKTLLHELTHHATVYKYYTNPVFKANIDSLYNEMKSKHKNDIYKGDLYGLKNSKEFMAESFTNPIFRDLVLRETTKGNPSIWLRLIKAIIKALGFKTKEYNATQMINEISDLVSNRSKNPFRLLPFSSKLNEELLSKSDINNMKKESTIIIQRLMNGLKSRYRSLKSQNYTPSLLTKIQQQIDKYEDLITKEDNKLIILDFIEKTDEAFTPVIRRIEKARTNPDSLSNSALEQFKNDFLGFYGFIIDQIDVQLFVKGYLNDIDPELFNKIKAKMLNINYNYKYLKGMYDDILKEKVRSTLKKYATEYKFPENIIDEYLDNQLNQTEEDINGFQLAMQTMASTNDLALRIAYRMIKDINNNVKRYSNNKTQDIVRKFDQISRQEALLYFEKDKDGKTTGNLVRDLNYGQMRKDMSDFLKELDAKYGVVDRNYYALDEENFFKYVEEKEKWLKDHVERKFKDSYYSAYNKLSPRTRKAINDINTEISIITADVTDDNGVHLERLSKVNWIRLDEFYNQKRNLGNIYYSDGTKKTGEDLKIAQEISEFHEAAGEGIITSKKYSSAEVQVKMKEMESKLSPAEYKLWKERNISEQYTQEFIDIIATADSKDMGSDAARVEELQKKRRLLLSLGKNNNRINTDAFKLQESVKQLIQEIDEELTVIRAQNKGPKRTVTVNGVKMFMKDFVEFVPTAEYKYDKEQAISKGDSYYDIWYKKNHYFNGFKMVPNSYYTRMVPKLEGYVEYRMSRMNREMDKNSDLINPKYNFEQNEYYQPKRELYDNTEAYKEATKTEQQKEVYKYITDTMSEAYSKLGYISKPDIYKLPQITGDSVDFMIRNNPLIGFKNKVLDDLIVRADDVEFSTDNLTQKANGDELEFIPTHFLKQLEKPEYISRNMIGLLSSFCEMAENYKNKLDKQGDFEIIKTMLGNRTFVSKDAIRKTQSVKSGEESHTYQKYKDFLEMFLYGQYKKTVQFQVKGLSGKEYNIQLRKASDSVKNYATANNLSNNYAAIGKALMQGLHKSIVEAIGDRYISKGTYFKALGRTLVDIPDMLFHLGDSTHNDYDLALLEHNGIARDVSAKTKDLQYNRGIRLLMKHFLWGGWSMVDYLVKAPVVKAVYADYKYIPDANNFMSKREYIAQYYGNDWNAGQKAFNKIDTFTMNDVYKVKDGVLVIKDEYKDKESIIDNPSLQNSIRNISEFLTNRIDGILSTEDKTRFMTNMISTHVFMHRSFFINNMNDNLLTQKKQYNPYIEDMYESKYISFVKGISDFAMNVFNYMKYNKEDYQTKKKHMDSVRSYNIRRTLVQVALFSLYSLLAAYVLRPFAEKDEDDWLRWYLGYIVAGTAFEERAEYWVLDFLNQIKSPSASIAPIENITNYYKFATNYDHYFNDDDIRKGPYKGQPRYQKTIIKSIPGLRGIWESRDIKTKWEYLDSQLDK